MTECAAPLPVHNYRRATAAAKPPANPTPLPPTMFIIAAPELDEDSAAVVGVESAPVVGASVVFPSAPVVVFPSAPVAVAPPAVGVGVAEPLDEQTTSSGTSTGGEAVLQMVFA